MKFYSKKKKDNKQMVKKKNRYTSIENIYFQIIYF